jgi:dephospho-CoA kinase
MARNGYSREDAGMRLTSQMPIGEKIPHADFVIRNEGPLEETRRAVGALWKKLRQRRSGVDRKPAD